MIFDSRQVMNWVASKVCMVNSGLFFELQFLVFHRDGGNNIMASVDNNMLRHVSVSEY